MGVKVKSTTNDNEGNAKQREKRKKNVPCSPLSLIPLESHSSSHSDHWSRGKFC